MANHKKDFETLLTGLEQVVAEMEQGDLSLEEMLKHYTAGMELAAACSEKLKAAEALLVQEKEETENN